MSGVGFAGEGGRELDALCTHSGFIRPDWLIGIAKSLLGRLESSVGARGDTRLMAGEGCAAAWFLVRYLNDDGDFAGRRRRAMVFLARGIGTFDGTPVF